MHKPEKKKKGKENETPINCLLGMASIAQAQDLPMINYMSSNDSSCSVYPQFVMQEFGYLEEEGYRLNMLSTATSVPYVAFLSNGDADIATLDSAQVLQAVQAKQPIKVVYSSYQFASEGIVVPADSPIQSLADLKGTTIGLASDRDLTTTVISAPKTVRELAESLSRIY